jgi:hydroxymethylglutaryl-CoA synthase
MAVAAGVDCVEGFDSTGINGLFLATTTSPYKEKQAAATVALAMDLPSEIRTADFGGSLRAGTVALGSAIDGIQSGSMKSVMVIASDCRMGSPKSQYEQLVGDGAAALLLGDSGVIASVEGSYSISNEILDVWRKDGDPFIKWWEDRFILSQGYQEVVQKCVSGLMQKYGVTAKDFTKVILYAPNPRVPVGLAKRLGFDIENQVQDPLLMMVGNTGAASVMMMLVSALEEAKAGDRFLVISYGDGCDSYIFQATEKIKDLKERRGVKGHISSKQVLSSYEKYDMLRHLTPVEGNPIVQHMLASAVAIWRERKKNIAFYGKKCKQCGTPQYPPQRICTVCQSKDEMEDYRFSDKKGKVFTYTWTAAAPVGDPPLVYAIVDFEGGGRIFTEMTDRDLSKLEVGMPVEMTFRKMQIPGAFHDYFWKCRPLR